MDNQAKATPRPWTLKETNYGGAMGPRFKVRRLTIKSGDVCIGKVYQNLEDKQLQDANASLIVKAVNAYFSLIQADHDATEKIGRLNSVNEALLEALKNYTLCGTAREVKPMRNCLEDALKVITNASK